MLAVAVPLSKLPPDDVTVIVNVWFVPMLLVAVGGLIRIAASTHVLLAGPLLPAVPSVVRVRETSPVGGMVEVGGTTVVPVVAEVITTVQLAVAPAPV